MSIIGSVRRSIEVDTIIKNAKIITGDVQQPFAWGVAIKDGLVCALLNGEGDLEGLIGSQTQIIDAQGKTVIPGLNDSHIHIIREGLNYTLELRWDDVATLKEAFDLLKSQVAIAKPGQWVRVVGGWTEYQFAEKRMPTLQEINDISSDVPIFIMHLYERVLLNKAALDALGDLTALATAGGVIEKDDYGNPTGLLLAHPGASLLYSALNKAPHLSYLEQVYSTKKFLQEMNRLGVTSAIDAGGGSQQYPENYEVVCELAAAHQLTVRIAYYLFTQNPGHEYEDFAQWVAQHKPGEGNDFYRLAGAGEMLVYSAADYENFFQARPDLPQEMESELTAVVRLLVKNRWPFRIHATYNESIARMLAVLEAVNGEIPFNGLRWFFDHAEMVSEKNLDRIKALGGGIAIQDRMAYQGEYFIERYGNSVACHAPPIQSMLAKDIPVGAGTDATRVASYNPWVCLYWLVSGKTVGGTQLYSAHNRLSRLQALALWTTGSAWFSGDEHKKGRIMPGQFADLALLSADYLSIPEEEIKQITSILTMVDGKIVYIDKSIKI